MGLLCLWILPPKMNLYKTMKAKILSKLSWLVIVFGVWLAARQIFSAINLYKSGNKLKQAESEILSLSTQKEDLQKKLDVVDSPEYVEKQLRDKLGYGKPGETVLVFPHEEVTNSQMPNIKSGLPDTNWKQWANLWLGWGSNPQP